MNEVSDFNVRLSDFDSSKPLPADNYNLAFVKSEEQEYLNSKTQEPQTRLNTRLVVVDHEKYSGRVIFKAFFPNSYTFKVFSKLSKVLGIDQEEGESAADWLERVATSQPPIVFNVPISVKDATWKDKNDEGEYFQENEIDWFNAQTV